MAEHYHSVVEIANSSGVNPAQVCRAAHARGVDLWVDVTGRCVVLNGEPVPEGLTGHWAKTAKCGGEPTPTGWVQLPQRDRSDGRATLASGESADAVDVAVGGSGVVYLGLAKSVQGPRALEEMVADYATGAFDDGEMPEYWKRFGISDKSAFVVLSGPGASQNGRRVLLRLVDLHIESRGVDLLGAKEGWTVHAPPPDLRPPEGLAWADFCDIMDASRKEDHSSELATAVRAWLALHRGHPTTNAKVAEFAEHEHKHGPPASGRIATLVNPDARKKGGAPCTPDKDNPL